VKQIQIEQAVTIGDVWLQVGNSPDVALPEHHQPVTPLRPTVLLNRMSYSGVLQQRKKIFLLHFMVTSSSTKSFKGLWIFGAFFLERL
jgi:hypothetical protein